MRRLLSVVVVAMALVAGSILLTSANADDRGKRDRSGETIRLTLKTVDSTELDLGKRGFSVGDRFIFTEKALDGRRRVGTAYGECTLVRLKRDEATSQCLVTLVLERGSLTAHGVITGSEEGDEPFTFAVTGGTDRYKGAGGEARVSPIDEEKSRLRIKLVN
jgi:hypothetical protein